MEQWYIIAGLGNPGAQYAQTRHNVGYMVVEKLAERWRVAWTRESRFSACLARRSREDQSILLCRPETYMNASGEAVGPLASFYRVERQNLLAVSDDADLPFGAIRTRPEGSSGGYHVVETVERQQGRKAIPRWRFRQRR